MSATTAKQFSYDYPRPALTVDIVVVTREDRPKVLLIQRKNDPFAGTWSLPGGFVDENERLGDAAKRELKEETGILVAEIEQLYTSGEPGRDPRGWTVSVVYLVRVNPEEVKPQAADDAEAVAWYPLDELPVLAFDHAMLLARRVPDSSLFQINGLGVGKDGTGDHPVDESFIALIVDGLTA